MKAKLQVLFCGAALLALASVAAAEDAKAPSPEEIQKAFEQAAKPGPEHQKLAEMAGKWDYTCKMWMDPSGKPMESKGTIERKLVLGGRFLEERYSGTNFDGKPGFEGFSLLGYDNAQKQYTSTWVCNTCTSTAQGVGTAAGDKFTFQTESFCPLQKQVIKGREEIRLEGSDKIVTESYITVDGKEQKMMELISTRQK